MDRIQIKKHDGSNHWIIINQTSEPISTQNQSDTNSEINESETEEVENQNDFNDRSTTKPIDCLLNPTELSLQDINNNSTLILGQTFASFSSFHFHWISKVKKYSKYLVSKIYTVNVKKK